MRTDPKSPMKNIALPPIRSPRKPFTSLEAAYTAKYTERIRPTWVFE